MFTDIAFAFLLVFFLCLLIGTMYEERILLLTLYQVHSLNTGIMLQMPRAVYLCMIQDEA